MPHPTYLLVHQASVPEGLVEVLAEAVEAVEEAEMEEVADAEVEKRAEGGRGSGTLTMQNMQNR